MIFRLLEYYQDKTFQFQLHHRNEIIARTIYFNLSLLFIFKIH